MRRANLATRNKSEKKNSSSTRCEFLLLLFVIARIESLAPNTREPPESCDFIPFFFLYRCWLLNVHGAQIGGEEEQRERRKKETLFLRNVFSRVNGSIDR